MTQSDILPSPSAARFAVIFHAELVAGAMEDPDYQATSARLRALAFDEYECRDFVSYAEGDREITISFWSDLDAVRRWKDAPEHKKAREHARSRWYRWYRVQVVAIERQYEYSGADEEVGPARSPVSDRAR